jgi:hypothetical protein
VKHEVDLNPVACELGKRCGNRIQAITPAFAAMAGDENALICPFRRKRRKLCFGRENRVDGSIAGHVDFAGRLFGSKVRSRGGRRGEHDFRLGINGGPILFFGPGKVWIVRSEAGFDMSDRHASGKTRQCRSEGARGIALHNQKIGAKAELSKECRSHCLNMAMRIFFTGTSETLNLQAAEAVSRGIEVWMLARQNELGPNSTFDKSCSNGSELDSLRPGADDQPNICVSQPSP